MQQNTAYLIDDSPEMVELLAEVARMSGMQPISYTDANDFFITEDNFDNKSILILDLQMPSMDGIEVMRKLSEFNSSPNIILISGQDDGILNSAEKLAKEHKLNILGSFTKPMSMSKLQNILEKNASTYNNNIVADTINREALSFTKAEIISAINNNEFTLHFQPKIDMHTNLIIGCEALIRWQHKLYGLLFPVHFLKDIEKHSLMAEISNWVINSIVIQQQNWKKDNININIAANISAENITKLTLPEKISSLLRDRELDPTSLTLEITETVLMDQLVTSLDILTRLRLKGIKLSIDDFGTGYSSLVQLHRIPFSELKIDRSFVSNMDNDKEAYSIVKTCIMLGHDLGMRVVAEGVETVEHLQLLHELNCDVAQGFYFSKPKPADEIKSMIIKTNSNK